MQGPVSPRESTARTEGCCVRLPLLPVCGPAAYDPVDHSGSGPGQAACAEPGRIGIVESSVCREGYFTSERSTSRRPTASGSTSQTQAGRRRAAPTRSPVRRAVEQRALGEVEVDPGLRRRGTSPGRPPASRAAPAARARRRSSPRSRRRELRISTPSMKPISMPRTLASTIVTELGQRDVPDRVDAGDRGSRRRCRAAPTPKATTIDADADERRWRRAFAPITRPRCGTRVKVVSPLRWLHSLVTDRIAIIGRITVIGMPIAAANVS